MQLEISWYPIFFKKAPKDDVIIIVCCCNHKAAVEYIMGINVHFDFFRENICINKQDKQHFTRTPPVEVEGHYTDSRRQCGRDRKMFSSIKIFRCSMGTEMFL